MRSRTSRGVPECSGGKDLYIGSPVSATGKVSGVTGIVPGPPEGSGGSTGRGPLPEGLMGCMEKGTSPSGLGRHTPLGPMRLGFGGNPKGGAPLLGGQAPLPLAAAPL